MYRQLIHQWYEEYKTGLFRFALSILKDEPSAEDVLQEIFLRMLTGRYAPEPGKERAYLYRCVRNLCFDELRRRRRLQEENTDAGAAGEYAFFNIIASLSEAEQQIVTLKIVGGLTYREIGKVMRITEQAAKKRYQRAIEKLREE